MHYADIFHLRSDQRPGSPCPSTDKYSFCKITPAPVPGAWTEQHTLPCSWDGRIDLSSWNE